MRKLLATLAIAGTFWIGTTQAHAGDYWARYHETNNGSNITRIVIKSACLGAEDSAAHLRLIGYSPKDHSAVYGCYRKGY